jgi:hypothetical protein
MFEAFLQKKVRIRQSDGYIKVGFLEKIEGGFLWLRYPNGKKASIVEKDIYGIEEFDFDDKHDGGDDE